LRFDLETKQLIDAVWNEKYRNTKDTNETSISHSARRICDAVYINDGSSNGIHHGNAYRSISTLDFVPGGRIWAGAGTGNNVTLLNCYVSPDILDSLDGIMDCLKSAAITMQQGGGIGMDFSSLRPRGSAVHRCNSTSSGVVPFMKMWNSMCTTIMSAGTRRGAMMAVLRCDHPDLLEFVNCKNHPGELTNFNISVLVTDKFMEAVKADAPWPLIHNNTTYKVCNARQVWSMILNSTYAHSEPGVIFIDTVNKENNLFYCENIHCTNPCGEQPLPPNGNCNLGAINLSNMVSNPFTDNAFLQWGKLHDTIATGVRFLDNVLDVTNYPLEEQRVEALAKRRLGLGVMGLGTMLQMLQLCYGSEQAINTTSAVMRSIALSAYEASTKLSHERGVFPSFDRNALLDSTAKPFCNRLSYEVYPRRNSHLLTVAPTGTTSLLAGNVSSGIEPSFAWQYERKMLMADGELKSFKVEDYGYTRYRELYPVGNLPDYMVTASDISVSEHISMQAAAQQWVDSAVSKTVNCPEGISFDEFKHVYEEAYKLGCKGCTTYRPSKVRGAVLCSLDGACSDEA